MRRPAARSLAFGLVVSLAATLGLSTTAGAEEDPTPAPSSPGAAESLAHAQALVSGKSGQPSHDATEALHDLWAAKSGLSGADAAAARGILNRPTEPDDQLGDYYGDGVAVEVACGDVCVHWTEEAGNENYASPEYAAAVLQTVNDLHATYVAAGYKAPLPDDGQGGNTKPDVYLAQIGDYAYGYCNTDQPSYEVGYSVYAFCVFDNDYSAAEFPSHTPLENMHVTAAHEYFHAVQAAYDWEEDFWLLEATATWVEDEMFDDINDNVNYLPYGQLGGPSSARGYPISGPSIPLDRMNFNAYGNWIWFRYLTEKYPSEEGGLPTLVRDIWRAADSTNGAANDQYSLQAIASVLAGRGTSLASEYAHFAVENNTPDLTYSEGAANDYPHPDHAFADISLTALRPQRAVVVQLDHMTSGTGTILPSPEMGAAWKLEVAVDMAAAERGSQAAVTVRRVGGAIERSFVALDAKGDGSTVVPFAYGDVESVEVTLVNSSTRMKHCDRGSPYACGGAGMDDRLAQQLKVTAFR